MNEFTFSKDAFDQYVSLQKEDRKTIKRINDLLEDIRRNGPMKGIGKPEALKHRSGYSRRIDDVNRLVYEIDELNNIKILSCKGHYENK